MKDFEEIYRANREKICALAEANTKRNAYGHTVISRDDPWFYEDEWTNTTKFKMTKLRSWNSHQPAA